MSAAHTGVRGIVHDLLAHLESYEGNLEAAQGAMAHCVRKLMAIEGLFEQGITRDASHHGSIESVTIYFDPEITVVMGKLSVGHTIPAHGHDTWEMMGVCQGELECTVYPKGNIAVDRKADLQPGATRRLKKGDIVICPGNGDHHGFRALTDVMTVAARGLVGGKALEMRGTQVFHR